jgi:hypothetical protein
MITIRVSSDMKAGCYPQVMDYLVVQQTVIYCFKEVYEKRVFSFTWSKVTIVKVWKEFD